MASITIIPAKKRVGTRVVQNEVPKTRVAAYCRVSTDTDEQATSYEAQVEHYTKYIKQNPAWESAGIYADDGSQEPTPKTVLSLTGLSMTAWPAKSTWWLPSPSAVLPVIPWTVLNI